MPSIATYVFTTALAAASLASADAGYGMQFGFVTDYRDASFIESTRYTTGCDLDPRGAGYEGATEITGTTELQSIPDLDTTRVRDAFLEIINLECSLKIWCMNDETDDAQLKTGYREIRAEDLAGIEQDSGLWGNDMVGFYRNICPDESQWIFQYRGDYQQRLHPKIRCITGIDDVQLKTAYREIKAAGIAAFESSPNVFNNVCLHLGQWAFQYRGDCDVCPFPLIEPMTAKDRDVTTSSHTKH